MSETVVAELLHVERNVYKQISRNLTYKLGKVRFLLCPP